MAVLQECDVVVVGAGLAGLRCALDLEATGLDVVVLEAADSVGGRVRTDEVDGFLVDRGFQLLNPAYPAVRDGVDVAALGLQQFAAGVAARTDDGVRRLGHPWHAPSLLPATARALSGELRGSVGLARWAAPALTPRRRTLRRHLQTRPDAALSRSLDDAGVTGLPRRVVDAFLAGVLLDDEGSTSTHFARLLVSSFVAGTPGLPRRGMRALPEQLASRLSRPVVTGSPAEGLLSAGAGGARTARGDVVARAVVVAVDAVSAPLLTDLPAADPGATRGVVTDWYAAPEPVVPSSRSRLLHVDARAATGPVVNAAVVSAAAPTYARAGAALVAASALWSHGRPPPDTAAMRRHAATILGCPSTALSLVARHEIRHALPRRLPPLDATLPVAVRPGLVVCGDHRETPSIQGALVSGRRAARRVLADLGLPTAPAGSAS